LLSIIADKFFDGDRKAVLALLIIVGILIGLVTLEWGVNSLVSPERECRFACGSEAELRATATAIAGELDNEIDLNDIIRDRDR